MITLRFHIVAGTDTKLFLETLREVGWGRESNHIADFAHRAFALAQKPCGMLEAHNLNHLVGRYIRQRLQLRKESAAADV